MSDSQSNLGRFAPSLLSRPARFNLIDEVLDRVQGIARDIGVPMNLFGARAGEIDPNVGVLRWQYSDTFTFYLRDRDDDDTKIGDVQFRTTVFTTETPSDEFREYIKTYNHRRLHTLFNSGEYDNYMSGFGFHDTDGGNVEGPIVAGHDEVPATGLGVPNFSVEVYNRTDGRLLGWSKGYSMDFGVHEGDVIRDRPPKHEVWRVQSLNEARNDYEIGPRGDTPARQRAKAAGGKVAYVNGFPVGSITSRGTVWLSREHKSPSRATYSSKRQIVAGSGTPHQAIQTGTKLYKVHETPDAVHLSTVQPERFTPTADVDVTPDATGAVDVGDVLDFDPDEPTTFVVTDDVSESWAMGKYDEPTVRDIVHETDFNIESPQR